MTIGVPLRCYPYKKKDGSFIYLPYDKTDFDLTFKGDKKDLQPITDYWSSIGKPLYVSSKTMAENMQIVFTRFDYWPEPLLSDHIIQTMLLDFVEDEDAEYFEFERKLNLNDPFGDKKAKKQKYVADEDCFDDEIPF